MKSKTVTGAMMIVLAMIVACATPTPQPIQALPTVILLPATQTIIPIQSTITPFPVVTATLAPTFSPTPTLAPTFTPTLPPTPLPTLASELKNRFVVLKPSAQDELNRIWDTLKNIAFYDQYGYTPTFPNDPLFKPLLEKAREKKLNNQDYADLSKLVLDKLYLSEDYDPSYQKVIASFPIVEQILPTFQKYNGLWGFKLFPVYTIRLTMYGMGGSYNPQKGEIILLTTKDATFARGTDPSDTIMHEAVHLGIEDVIIQKFSIDQRVKERIVDRFMFDHFLSLVPRYRMQSIGDTAIDKYLSGGAAWENLPEKIKEFKNGK